jgi:hypothetical protein
VSALDSTLTEGRVVAGGIARRVVLYLAENVPQHKLLHDAYAYRRIGKRVDTTDEERCGALEFSRLLTEAYEMRERHLRGEEL